MIQSSHINIFQSLVCLCLLLLHNPSFYVQGRLSANVFTEAGVNVDGEYIILFKETETINNSVGLMEVNNVSTKVEYLERKYYIEKNKIFTDALYGFSAKNITNEDAKNIENEDDVLLVESNALISIENTLSSNVIKITQNLNCEKETIPDGVKRVGWRDIDQKKKFSDKRVFIIDTGIAVIPEELNIDTTLARNFVGDDPNDWEDCHGHGTHIAGTIGAKHNNCGVVGVAAGITVVPVRVVDCRGGTDLSRIVDAINYVSRVGKEGDVVNLSLGGAIPQTSMDIGVKNGAEKGIKFAIAAGNSRENSIAYSPARAEGDGIYTVCSVDEFDRISPFSNYGQPPIDTCAPGEDILSLDHTGGLSRRTGTSMSAPHIAGLLALGDIRHDGLVALNKEDGREYPIARKKLRRRRRNRLNVRAD